MSVEQICVPGVSSRRFACDRCRNQKLRCLREQADQRCCDRCLRADVECLTSPVFRMRSYVGGDIATSKNNNSGGERARKRARILQHNIPRLQMQPREAASQPSESDVDAVAETSHTPLDLLADVIPAILEVDTHLPSSMIPGNPDDFSPMNMAGDVPWDDVQWEEFGVFNELPMLSPPETGASQMSSLIQDPSSHGQYSSADSLPTPSFSSSTYGLQSVDHRSGVNLAANHDSNDRVSGSGTIQIEPEETHLQRLSNINSNIVTLLARMDQGTSTVTIETLVAPIDESSSHGTRLDDMLNCTREFLEVLNLLAGHSASSHVSHSKSNTARPSLRRHANSPSETDDSIASSPTTSPSSLVSTPPSRSNAQAGSKLDFASLLLILTSYVHVLRLYVVLFAHMYDYLKELADSDNPYLCPLPGLSFCRFPLQSGNLQTIILIQIVTSLFERMERVLGLPREFRINSHGDDLNGLLSDDDFADIMKSVFRKQESGQSENRAGGVKALRKYVKKTKQLLRDSIAL